jgi:hypothetical protein
MKKIFFSILFLVGITACENQPWEFPDYDLQAVYFPIQLPVRTLSLGEDRIDNSLDKEYKFDIAVNIGGMYQNKRDWTVDYKIDTSLTTKAYIYSSPQLFTQKQKIIPLPAAYYTISPLNTVVIPSGSFEGRIRIQLNDQFFNDTVAVTGRYVVPLKITSTSADSILSGKAAVTGADPRIIAQWDPNKSPKNWVLFGINYYNAYHGTYLHRGRDIRIAANGAPFDSIVFRNKYVEKDALIVMSTAGRQRIVSNGLANKTGGNYTMMLDFTNDKGTPGAITISQRHGFPYVVTGTGQYKDISTSVEEWTGLKWQSMYLSYTYNDGTYTHQVKDTLVFRDRGIKFMTNSLVIKP